MALEKYFERALWKSRLLIGVPVVASMVAAVGMIYIATVDVFKFAYLVSGYGGAGHADGASEAVRAQLLVEVVDIIDGYLLAAVLIIFALGLYELFISRIDEAENSEVGSRLLLIRSLDDLKDRLAQVVLLILVIKFFQAGLKLKFASPIELLFLAGGILLVAGALYLASKAKAGKKEH